MAVIEKQKQPNGATVQNYEELKQSHAELQQKYETLVKLYGEKCDELEAAELRAEEWRRAVAHIGIALNEEGE